MTAARVCEVSVSTADSSVCIAWSQGPGLTVIDLCLAKLVGPPWETFTSEIIDKIDTYSVLTHHSSLTDAWSWGGSKDGKGC